jgi:hypothetical protein
MQAVSRLRQLEHMVERLLRQKHGRPAGLVAERTSAPKRLSELDAARRSLLHRACELDAFWAAAVTGSLVLVGGPLGSVNQPCFCRSGEFWQTFKIHM